MSLDNHPASFDFIQRDSSRPADVPPTVWTHEGLDYDLARDDAGWEVVRGGVLLGRLAYDLPADDQEPLHWRVRDPQHEGFGIGASWGDWQDAVIALIDYRAQRDA